MPDLCGPAEKTRCRTGCGACCIAPSIAQPYHGMPAGKAAGERCVHLGADYDCALFADSRRPALCAAFTPEAAVCGENRVQALALMAAMEIESEPQEGRHWNLQ